MRLSGCAKPGEVLPLGMTHCSARRSGFVLLSISSQPSEASSLLFPYLGALWLRACSSSPCHLIFMVLLFFLSLQLWHPNSTAAMLCRAAALTPPALLPVGQPNLGGTAAPNWGQGDVGTSHPHLFPSLSRPFLSLGLIEANPLLSAPPHPGPPPHPQGVPPCPPPLPMGHQPCSHPMSALQQEEKRRQRPLDGKEGSPAPPGISAQMNGKGKSWWVNNPRTSQWSTAKGGIILD